MAKKIFFLGFFLALISPQISYAHTALSNSSIKPGAQIQSLPANLILTFSEPLLSIKNKEVNWVKILDPKGSSVAGVESTHGLKLVVAIDSATKLRGTYKVNYRVVAEDGHPKIGGFTFTLN